jgi:hypothetical protein
MRGRTLTSRQRAFRIIALAVIAVAAIATMVLIVFLENREKKQLVTDVKRAEDLRRDEADRLADALRDESVSAAKLAGLDLRHEELTLNKLNAFLGTVSSYVGDGHTVNAVTGEWWRLADWSLPITDEGVRQALSGLPKPAIGPEQQVHAPAIVAGFLCNPNCSPDSTRPYSLTIQRSMPVAVRSLKLGRVADLYAAVQSSLIPMSGTTNGSVRWGLDWVVEWRAQKDLLTSITVRDSRIFSLPTSNTTVVTPAAN